MNKPITKTVALCVGFLLPFTSLAYSAPPCNTSNEGSLVYQKAEGKLLTCSLGTWEEIGVPAKAVKGDAGQKGATGATGATGPQGVQGAAGEASANYQKGSDLNSDTQNQNVTIGSNDYFVVSGATALISFESKAAGSRVRLRFSSYLTVTHDLSHLILLGGGNYKAASGDQMEFISEGSGVWREIERKGSNDSYVQAHYATAQTITPSTDLTLLFDQEVTDTQSEYDPATGFFTATQSGMYSIVAQVRSANINWNSANHIELMLLHRPNGSGTWSSLQNSRVTAFSNITQRMTTYINLIVPLQVGDSLRIDFNSAKAAAIDAATGNTSAFLQIRRI